eukprot:2758947-Amphidinium_carterae.1
MAGTTPSKRRRRGSAASAVPYSLRLAASWAHRCVWTSVRTGVAVTRTSTQTGRPVRSWKIASAVCVGRVPGA